VNTVKAHYAQLVKAVVDAASSSGTGLARLLGVALYGVALYDTGKDLLITSLKPFSALEAGVRELAQVKERCGDQSHRIALQLVYEYFARKGAVVYDSASVDSLWNDFATELESPVWVTRAVTNLRYFDCEDVRVDLGDGVSIYGRDANVLASLGFCSDIVERLFAGWGGFGSSSFVLVAEATVPKKPNNFISLDTGDLWLRCARAIGALRLCAPGDVGISSVFVQRVAGFNVGIGGITSTGSAADTLGNVYRWSAAQHGLYSATYSALAHLEKVGYRKAPGNLDLALRAFMSTYDRFPTALDTKLVDSITALEAVLGTDSEIAFKLSFRVASLLASSDEQRAALLKTVKSFYDTRSRIVHGGRLGTKHHSLLATVDDLRHIVRRLLRSFVRFAASDANNLGKKFFVEELDAALLDPNQRDALRHTLRLTESA
jgi:hypothetical protein